MNPTKTEAIKRFLTQSTHPDLAALYNHDMEVQVMVEQDGGTRIEDDYKGRQWHGWTDGFQVWKTFRIPHTVDGNVEYEDTPISFDLGEHASGIGMTGWDWVNKVSHWVGFDFDAITGHSEKHTKKLTQAELDEITQCVINISWVTIRKSTSGKGLHLYVPIPLISTISHTEHAALARSILSQMSGVAGIDFSIRVDNCGWILWQWHRKMAGATDGLTLIKSATEIVEVSPNWRDHVPVITKHRKKNRPMFVPANADTLFEAVTSERKYVTIDSEHRKLMTYLEGSGSWWDSDHHMLITHTHLLKEAHEALSLRGIFETLSTGSQSGDVNCFACPAHNGGWIVRRYTPGVAESPTWTQDNAGWTQCYYNREPDFATACRTYEGIEQATGSYTFKHAEQAQRAAILLGSDLALPNWALGRGARLKMRQKDNKLIAEIDADKSSDIPLDLKNWYSKGKVWERVLNSINENETIENHDNLIRHMVTATGDDSGWVIFSDNKWREEPSLHVKLALKGMGYSAKDADLIMGTCITQCWTLVNQPFQPEYPGDRQWNRNAAQFRFHPTSATSMYPTWLTLLNHWGRGLDDTVKDDEWCKTNAIQSGAEYLKVWIASLFQFPYEPLPYLFFYSPEENTGKSTFYEALSLLVTKGVVRADHTLTNPSGFNGELANAFLCIVEETDLRKSKQAHARIKDWVTSEKISIRPLYVTTFDMPNISHWAQFSNDQHACPIHLGDTRITMIRVFPLDQTIPRRELRPLLEKEASDFLGELLRLEIPQSNGRLNIPILTTPEKKQLADSNRSIVQMFIDENTYPAQGKMIPFGEFYERLVAWMGPSESQGWTKQRLTKEIPPHIPAARIPQTNYKHLGNISWEPYNGPELPRLIVKDDKLIPSTVMIHNGAK